MGRYHQGKDEQLVYTQKLSLQEFFTFNMTGEDYHVFGQKEVINYSQNNI